MKINLKGRSINKMTCFWDGILSSLDENDFKLLRTKKSNTISAFIDLLKRENRKTVNVSWNGEPLSDNQLAENYTAVQSYDKNTAGEGYFCSVCDPFLLLVAELFQVTVRHTYLGVLLHYTHKEQRKTVNYLSDGGHFQNKGQNVFTAILPHRVQNMLPNLMYGAIGLLSLKLLLRKKNDTDIYNGTTTDANESSSAISRKKRMRPFRKRTHAEDDS
jgi:hypothetical protein